ncbi:MAG: SBBP repeat-containing protein [Bacteroidetes bacterium]|nr:SBBP repeat-containing protein [Bacteroidota bacterium]
MPSTLLLICCLALYTGKAQTYQWAKSLGATDEDMSKSIAVDGSGNVYTTGFFTGTVDFDPGPGISNLTCVGDKDIFISKLDAMGHFLWAKAWVESIWIGGILLRWTAQEMCIPQAFSRDLLTLIPEWAPTFYQLPVRAILIFISPN